MNFTLVTSLVNINRENWQFYQRSWCEYQKYMQNVLRIDAPFCIFVEEDSVQFIEECRQNFPNTKIYTVSLQDYKLYTSLERITEIQNSQEYKDICAKDSCPEVVVPLYDIVVNNKIDYLYQASLKNPFNTEYFVWIDAGYGHCKFEIPFSHSLNLDNYLEKAKHGKMILNSLQDQVSSNDPLQFFKDHQDFIDGGLIVTHKSTIEDFHQKYYEIIDVMMRQNIIDDDQYFMTLMYIYYPELIDVHRIPHWDFRQNIILNI